MLELFKSARSFLAAFLLTATLLVSAHATTYYVSNTGNDGNNGTSTSTPWQTAAKVNGFALNPGDIVLFQRGGIWREQLNITRDGAAGNPITFADYGTGNKPTFAGSDILANSGFTSAGGTKYNYNFGSARAVLVNHVFLQNGDPNTTLNTWAQNGGTLTINVPTNPNTDGNLYTVVTRSDEIQNLNHSHYVFRNLIADETGSIPSINDGYCVRTQGGVDVLYDSVEATRGGKHNFGCIDSDSVTYNNCYAAYVEPDWGAVGGATVYVSYADNDPGGHSAARSTYTNSTADHLDDGHGGFYQSFVCHGAQLGQTTFNNFTSTAGKFSVLQDSGGNNQNVTVNGGTWTNCDFETYARNMSVNGATLTGESSFDVYGTNIVFQNCKMINITEPSGGATAFWTAILLRPGALNNIFRFNTIVMDPSTGNGSTCVAMQNHGSQTQAYGNIFLSHTGKVVNVWAAGASSPPNNTDVTNWDFNWYQSSPTPIFDFDNISFATWKTDTGADAHTLTGDPIFNNPSGGDYTLSPFSPALNTVAITTETPALPTTDFAGNPRKFGSAYDPGAYELQQNQQVPPAPVITSASTASGHVGSAFSYQITATNTPTSFGASPLPAGTSVNTSTGLINGTTSTAGTTNTAVSATNAGGVGTLNVVITVTLVAPVITSSGSASGTWNGSFSYQITASGSPTSYGASPLPAGLSVNTGTGLISGSPTALGSTTTVVSATNAAGTGTKNVTITISSNFNVNGIYTTGTTFSTGGLDSFGGAYVSSELGTSVNFNGSSFTFASSNVADGWSNVVVALPAGSYTTLNMVGTSSGGIGTSQTFTVTYTDLTTQVFTQNMSDWGSGTALAGETKVVNMPDYLNSSGNLVAAHRYLSGYTLTLNGKAVKSITLPTARGVVMFGFAAGSSSPIPVITSALTKSGVVGTALSYTITATNTPTSYGATPLPAGLSVNTGTGVISGTPSAAGSTNTTISATNASGTGSATLVFTISAGPPVINSALTKSGTTGVAFSYNITATNSPTSYGAAPLPAGLSVNTGTGLISGTPTAGGTTSTTISATNAAGTGSATLVITIATAFNINGIYTTGTTFSTGGLDSFGNAYVASEIGTTAVFDGQTFTFGPANAVDAWNNVTVALTPGTYTTLDMLATAAGGNVSNQTFTVNYSDATTSVFTIGLHDWKSTSLNAGESKVVTMTDTIGSNGALTAAANFVHGYTFTLNGKSVVSITLPAARQVVVLGFKGH